MIATRRPNVVWVATIVLAIGVAASVSRLNWNLEAISSFDALRESWARFVTFLAAFGAPDLTSDALATVGRLMLETLSVAVLGVALGLLLAWPLAMSASHALVLGDDPGGWRPLRRVWLEANRLLLDILRGVPDFVWALLFANFLGISTPTGVCAIAISVAGILGKIFSEQWDNQDPQRYAALRSTGAGRLQLFLYGIQPLSARSLLSFLLMRTECAIRNASVIGVIAGGGLGAGLWDAFKDSRYDFVVTLLAGMLVLTASADLVANWLRYQLRVDPNHPRAANQLTRAGSTRRRLLGVASCVALVALAVAASWPALCHVAVELETIEGDFAWSFVRRLLLSPDFSVAKEALCSADVPLASALLTTLGAAALASLLAFPASVAFQLHPGRFTGERGTALHRARRWLLVVATRGFALVARGVPEVAWVLILGAFFRQGLLAGVLAVTLHSTGVLLRVFVETIDNVPYRRLEQVAGTCRPQMFVYGAVPTAWRDWRTYTFFQFEVNMRMGIVLGMVGAGGLGSAFDTHLKFAPLQQAGTYLWTMVLLTVLVDRSSRWLQLRRNRC